MGRYGRIQMRQSRWGEAVVPGVIVLYVITYLVQTYDLPFRTILFPYMVMGLLVSFLLVFAVQQAIRNSKSAREEKAEARAPGVQLSLPSWAHAVSFCRTNYKALTVIILTFLFPHVIKSLGFFITATLYLAALFWVFDTMRRAYMLPATVVIVAFLTWLLLEVLSLALPRFAFVELPFNL